MTTTLSKAARRRLDERVASYAAQLRYARAHRVNGDEIARLERRLAEAQQRAKGSK